MAEHRKQDALMREAASNVSNILDMNQQLATKY